MTHLYIKCYAKVNNKEKLMGMRFLKRGETISEAENSCRRMFPNYELTFDYSYAYVSTENYSQFICNL